MFFVLADARKANVGMLLPGVKCTGDDLASQLSNSSTAHTVNT